MQDAAVVAPEGLADTPDSEAWGDQPPEHASKCAGAAGGLQGSNQGQDSKRKLDKVREDRPGEAALKNSDDSRVGPQQDDRQEHRLARYLHISLWRTELSSVPSPFYNGKKMETGKILKTVTANA